MAFRREVATYHAVIFTLVRERSHPDRRLHLLYTLSSAQPPAPFVALLEYFLDKGRLRAFAWQRDTARAVGLFIDFLVANETHLRLQPPAEALAAFAEALVYGTIDLVS